MAIALSLIVGLLAAPGSTDFELFDQRYQKHATDAAELLSLGDWCEKNNHPAWAKRCYHAIRRLGASDRDVYCQASFRLSEIEISQRKFESAYPRLRELVGKFQYEKARTLLQEAESQQTRKQQSYFEKGKTLFEKERYDQALKAFESAYELCPENPGGGAYVPRKEILRELARCRKIVDEQFYQKKVKPVSRSVEACSRCEAAGGFVTCSKCGGKGKVKQLVLKRYRGRIVRRYELVRCDLCGGHRFRGCGTCLGVGAVASFDTKERNALEKVCNRVRHPRVLKGSVNAAMNRVEEALLKVDESSTLNYFRSVTGNYTHSQKLRDCLQSVPPESDELRKLGNAWLGARGDVRVGVNFLMNYACEFASYLARFDMLRGGTKPNLKSFPEANRAADVLSPDLLAAFPDEESADWLRVTGLLTGYSETPDEFKGTVEIEGEIEHNVKFFVWLPEARTHLARLENGPWRKRLSGHTSEYPFDIRRKIAAAPEQHHVVLTGRFLRDRLGYPPNWFEVWDVEVGMSKRQEQIYRALREPIEEVSFEFSLARVASVFKNWYDVELDLSKVSKNTLLSCEARNCPIGLVIDAIARSALGVNWYYKNGRVVFTPKRTGDRTAENIAAVVERLRRENPGEVVASRITARRGATTELAADPAGLRVLARKAVLDMDYATADSCFAKLASNSDAHTRNQLLPRLRQKMSIFRMITGTTPVSRLVDADELTEIVYRKPSGDFRQATVRILRRDAGGLLIQEAYGARLSVKIDEVRSEKPLAVQAWRTRKAAELERREKEIEGTSGLERASKLFLLALFAKTNAFTERGSEFLEQAFVEERFPWVLENYHPDLGHQLVSSWKYATGRDEATLAAAQIQEPVNEPEVDEPPATAEAVVAASLPEQPGELYSYARQQGRHGSIALNRTLKGANAAQWRKKALAHFEEARRAVDRLLEIQPDNQDAQSLRRDLTQLIQHCNKDLGFFD